MKTAPRPLDDGTPEPIARETTEPEQVVVTHSDASSIEADLKRAESFGTLVKVLGGYAVGLALLGAGAYRIASRIPTKEDQAAMEARWSVKFEAHARAPHPAAVDATLPGRVEALERFQSAQTADMWWIKTVLGGVARAQGVQTPPPPPSNMPPVDTIGPVRRR